MINVPPATHPLGVVLRSLKTSSRRSQLFVVWNSFVVFVLHSLVNSHYGFLSFCGFAHSSLSLIFSDFLLHGSSLVFGSN